MLCGVVKKGKRKTNNNNKKPKSKSLQDRLKVVVLSLCCQVFLLLKEEGLYR